MDYNKYRYEKRKKEKEAAMSQIEKQFGKGSVMKLGEFKAMEIEAIPTGALSLDMALGIGGVPRGRIIEVFGPESSGKTTLALHIFQENRKIKMKKIYVLIAKLIQKYKKVSTLTKKKNMNYAKIVTNAMFLKAVKHY